LGQLYANVQNHLYSLYFLYIANLLMQFTIMSFSILFNRHNQNRNFFCQK
jgi:hypothetical protein